MNAAAGLDTNMTLYICTDVALGGYDWLETALDRLPRQRGAHASRYRNQQDRALSVAAFLLLQHGLKSQYGLELNEDLAYTAAGKPYLARHRGIEFSLSHSGGAVACAVSEDAVGVDIERIQAYDADMAAYCCDTAELDRISSSADKGERFTEIWTRKESALKQAGATAPDDLRHIPEMKDKRFHTIQTDGYICTVCSGGAAAVEVRQVALCELLCRR